MKQKKKLLLAVLIMAVVVLAGAGGYYVLQIRAPGNAEGSQEDGQNTRGETAASTEITEEEKEIMESQTGVTVTEDGVMEVNIGEILAEESSVKITREQAREIALESLGEETEIGACDIREHEGVKYWVVQADKGKETYQIWLNADTGEEFINQKVG